MELERRIRCPNPACPDPNDVHKISEIVRAGTHSEYSSGSAYVDATWVPVSVTKSSSTALAMQLQSALPLQPSEPSSRTPNTRVSCMVMFWATVFAIAAGICGLIAITPMVPSSSWLPDLACFGPAVLIVPLVIVWANHYLKAQRVAAQTQYSSDWYTYQAQLQTYMLAQERWDAIYYSPRCGTVFIPGEMRFVPIDQIDLLMRS